MPVAWPGTLPAKPLYNGYTETPPNVVLRTQMDAGPPKQRKRYAAGIRTIAMVLELTKAQVAVLDDFYVNQINGGVDPFTWVHPRTDAAVTFRFNGTPQVYEAWASDGYVARFTLEILPP